MSGDVVAPGFEMVAHAFAQLVADGAIAALHVRRDRQVVVDLAAGADALGRPFTTDRPVYVYSAIKPVTALAALALVRDRALHLDAPVAATWPEFAAHGKTAVTFRQALAHAAGVPGWPRPITLDELLDWDTATALLADQPPWWPPGEPGEHALSYGHLVGEVVRRAAGSAVDEVWRREFAGPDGIDITFHPGAGERAPAPVVDPDGTFAQRMTSHAAGAAGVLRNPVEVLHADVVNDARFGAALVPAITGYASAASLARLYEWWCGDEAAARLGRELRDASLTPQSAGHDRILEREVQWGLGPQLDATSLGMGGVGGCAGWYELGPRLAVGWTTPQLGGVGDTDPLDQALALVG